MYYGIRMQVLTLEEIRLEVEADSEEQALKKIRRGEWYTSETLGTIDDYYTSLPKEDLHITIDATDGHTASFKQFKIKPMEVEDTWDE